jgi:hypothetical protein
MADYTESTSAPTACTHGFYAIHIVDIGKVWLSETNSFKSTLSRFRSNSSNAQCVKDAFARGAKIELWFLTQPKRFSAQKLEDELWQLDLLAERKARVMEGPGMLYCIRHRVTHDYFVVTDRLGTAPTTILCNFLTRLKLMGGNARNKALADFITSQTEDIIKEMNFDIHVIDKFADNDDKWLRRQVYIDDCKLGRNLNLNSVD